MGTGNGYDREVFRPSIFEFGYKDVRNTIIWMAQPLTDEIMNSLSEWDISKVKIFLISMMRYTGMTCNQKQINPQMHLRKQKVENVKYNS